MSKKIISIMLTLAMCLSLIASLSMTVSAAEYPSISSSKYIEFTAAKKMTVYVDKDFSAAGTSSPYKKYSAYIAKNDVCYIYKITSKYAQVNYPTSSGRKTGFIKTKDLLGKNMTPSSSFTATSKVTTYKYKNGAETGYYESGDAVYVLDGTNYNVIYTAKSGNRAYKLAWRKVVEQNPEPEQEKETVVNNITYAPYNGVDYTKLTTNKTRLAALNKAKQMVTVKWTAPCDFVTWAGSDGGYNKTKDINGRVTYKFEKKHTYIGVPYCMNNRTYDDKKWINLLNNGVTSNGMKEKWGNYPTAGTKYGIDCSAFVATALKEANSKHVKTLVGSIATSNMTTYIDLEKIELSEMQPGDIFLRAGKPGHTMMFVGKTSAGEYAVFEAKYTYSKCQYATYSKSELSSYGCYTFEGY